MLFHPFEIAFCGYSGSGKTTLIASLVRRLAGKFSIACYKHGCHRFDIDRQGKDSWALGDAGAETVMISDPEKKAVISRHADELNLLERQAFSAHDILFVEGLKELPLQKILLVDSERKILDLLCNDSISNVFALVTPDDTAKYADLDVPAFHRDDIGGIACFIENALFSRSSENTPLYGLILAGGLSSRMGHDKALIRYHAQNQLLHSAALLRKHCAKVFLSCRADQCATYCDFNIPMITDAYLGIGPIGGLLSAQQAEPGAAWLIAACDLPFLDETMISQLVMQRNPLRFASAFRNPGSGLIEPLIACYEPKSRSRLLLLHADGCNALSAFLENSRIEVLLPLKPEGLRNVNTPGEYQNPNCI
ncbi:MAG: bifunctional molybdenum cofactor guanylyltransferase MobA/molybdopterin-guanine dinucleotide biosynthesis adaptor protein MobB [Chlorobiaceae bacterium]|nr:bifunctional molybdenum cofactor guanylyltransferase MobA/molybdopterin-guanine dinucleotide biosynthesis adaptor protein MobB [Chlorobiaceae bacterium]NTW10884.1 bifunctional molybdenum cofactor guanylyltransferase MobA/molybdopterin-guanine dinucleotide biosynthesis adaptor protein MobB [Chlorobiaceae bacterium]